MKYSMARFVGWLLLLFSCIVGLKSEGEEDISDLKYHFEGEQVIHFDNTLEYYLYLYQEDTDFSRNLSVVSTQSIHGDVIKYFDFTANESTLYNSTGCYRQEYQVVDYAYPFYAVAALAREPDRLKKGQDTTFNGIPAKMVEQNYPPTLDFTFNITYHTYWLEKESRLLGFKTWMDDRLLFTFTIFNFYLGATQPGVFDPPKTRHFCTGIPTPETFPEFGEVSAVKVQSTAWLNGNFMNKAMSLDLENVYFTLVAHIALQNNFLIADVPKKSQLNASNPTSCEVTPLNEILVSTSEAMIDPYRTILFQNTTGIQYVGKQVVRNMLCSVYQAQIVVLEIKMLFSWYIADAALFPGSSRIPIVQSEGYVNGELMATEHVSRIQKEDPIIMRMSQSLDISTCYDGLTDLLQVELKVPDEDQLYVVSNPQVLSTLYSKLLELAGLEYTTQRITAPSMIRSEGRVFFQFTLLHRHPNLPNSSEPDLRVIKDKITDGVDSGELVIDVESGVKKIHIEALKGTLKPQFQYEAEIPIIPTTTEVQQNSTTEHSNSTEVIPTSSTQVDSNSTEEIRTSSTEVDSNSTEVIKSSSTDVPPVTGSSSSSSTASSFSPSPSSDPTDQPLPTELPHLLGGGTFGGVAVAMLLVGLVMGSAGTYVKMIYYKKQPSANDVLYNT